MRNGKERRRAEASRLRTYIDAVKDAEKMTDAEWIDQWVSHCTIESVYMSRSTWLAILRQWTVEEATRLAEKMVA